VIYKQGFTSYNGSVENLDLSDKVDWADIQACLAGEKAAFERLIRRHQNEITKLCWRFSRNSSICERLVQDTFVEAYFSLKNYKAKGSFIGWLKKIATRIGYKFWKERNKERRVIPIDDIDLPASENRQEIEPVKAAEILNALLEKLEPSERLVLTLIYLEDCPIKDIAYRMSWTIAGTKMRAMRARRKLKKIAEKEKILEKLVWMQ
jgi:RNA polymerase sigma-70 factor (ECF subfamily)